MLLEVVLFNYFWVIIFPLVVWGVAWYCITKDVSFGYPSWSDVITGGIMGGMVGLIAVIFGLMLCSAAGTCCPEDDALYYKALQTNELNGVKFNYTEQRYIDIVVPEDFYGRITILNTETRHALFGVAITKGEVFSKELVSKRYKIDTAYEGNLNQITVEIENKEVYESHVYTIVNKQVRPVDAPIMTAVHNAKILMA